MNGDKLSKEGKKELPTEQSEQEKQEKLDQAKQDKLVTGEQILLKDRPDHRISELEALLKRLQADFDNARKRHEKERQEIAQQANASLLLKLLSFVDEFEHTAMESKKHHAKDAAALEMLHKNLMKILDTEGIREMQCNGESFDPYKHDAIKQEQSDFPEGKICSVLKKGYYFNQGVLRHAMVIVSAGNKPEAKSKKPEDIGGKHKLESEEQEGNNVKKN